MLTGGGIAWALQWTSWNNNIRTTITKLFTSSLPHITATMSLWATSLTWQSNNGSGLVQLPSEPICVQKHSIPSILGSYLQQSKAKAEALPLSLRQVCQESRLLYWSRPLVWVEGNSKSLLSQCSDPLPYFPSPLGHDRWAPGIPLTAKSLTHLLQPLGQNKH